MKKSDVILVTVEEIEELLSVIDYEYEYAKFCKYEYLQNPDNFESEEHRMNFAISTSGLLFGMERVTGKLTQTSIMKRLYSE